MSKSDNPIIDPVIVKHFNEHPLSASRFIPRFNLGCLKGVGKKSSMLLIPPTKTAISKGHHFMVLISMQLMRPMGFFGYGCSARLSLLGR